MPLVAVIFGGLLIGVGLVGYFDPILLGQFDKISPTALIPAAIGGVIVLGGVVSLIAPGARKHAMHLAVLAGVFGVVGGFMPLFRSQFNFQKASAVSGVLSVGLSLLFVLLCVRSFIAARRARTGP